MWLVEVEREVEQWIESLSVREFATVAAVERLAEDGSRLRFPAFAVAGRRALRASGSALAASRGGSRSTSRKTGGLFC